ncbi:MAG: hypothetical protein WBZ29_06710 [Methanocella sp.]
MDISKILILALATAAVALFMTPAGAFIGVGVNLDKHLGDTINFDLNPTLVQAAGAAYGLADMDLGVIWGVDYDLSTMAGYPYGYGGVGAVTDGNIGYSLGLSMDETHAAGFDGSAFGIPLTEGSQSTTSYNNLIARNDHLSDVQVALPFF